MVEDTEVGIMIRDRQELQAAILEFVILTEAVNAIGRSREDTISDAEFGAEAGPLVSRMSEIAAEALAYAETLKPSSPTCGR